MRSCLLVAATLCSNLAWADAPETAALEDPAALPPIEVLASPSPRSELQTPAAVGVIDAETLHSAQPQIDLAETLARIPGIDVRDRQNDAQDLQVQSRGYGARASFGVRGIQIRADGIPLTASDGQGQTSNLLINGLDRIEVLRGPMAYQYGNAAGGVIAAYAAEPPQDTEFDAAFGTGSDDTWRAALGAGGRAFDDTLGYRLDFARYDSNGYRDHSASHRNQAALNARYALDDSRELRVLASGLWDAFAQDPLGLTREQFEQNPQQAAAAAASYNTRKRIDDWRSGVGYTQRWGNDTDLDLIGYVTDRAIVQFLSIPKSVQASPARAGGVIDLQRSGYGSELRMSHRFAAWSLRAGLQYQSTDEHRRGYENFVGDTLGVQGALRRDENNRIDNFDQYVVAEYPFAQRWTLSGAVRHSQVNFESDDHYITDGNPDDSGSADYDATVPALSLAFAPSDDRLLYLSAGAGFETPTFNELSYRSDGESGLNLALDAARSRSVELGWKQAVAARGLLTLALFQIDGDDEIVPAGTIDGRASFQNAGATRRRGAEFGLSLPLPAQLQLQLAANWLDARFVDSYSYPASGETVTVDDGNRIPGVARNSVYSELAWRRARPGWSASVEARYSDEVPVDDRNSDAAPSYVVVNLGGAYRWQGSRTHTEVFVRLYNLFDERYAGSVIVNDGNGRFFEQAPERNVYAGVAMQFGG
jgi:iron complex outermembrane receptor protein